MNGIENDISVWLGPIDVRLEMGLIKSSECEAKDKLQAVSCDYHETKVKFLHKGEFPSFQWDIFNNTSKFLPDI